MTIERKEMTDFTKYDLVKCPKCKGKGSTYNADDCGACGGYGELPREHRDHLM